MRRQCCWGAVPPGRIMTGAGRDCMSRCKWMIAVRAVQNVATPGATTAQDNQPANEPGDVKGKLPGKMSDNMSGKMSGTGTFIGSTTGRAAVDTTGTIAGGARIRATAITPVAGTTAMVRRAGNAGPIAGHTGARIAVGMATVMPDRGSFCAATGTGTDCAPVPKVKIIRGPDAGRPGGRR